MSAKNTSFFMQRTVLCGLLCVVLSLGTSCVSTGSGSMGQFSFVNADAYRASMGPSYGKSAGDANLDDYGDAAGSGDLDDYGDNAVKIHSIADPLEPWNRFWFGFNDIFYLYIAKPVYTAYDSIMNDDVQKGMSNALNNFLFPARFVNALLQGKFKLAGVEMGRFLINTTVGFGGFIDVTKSKKTVVPYTREGEDFGQTLAHWGAGDGFYLVLPILGPSSLRDGVGSAVDFFIDPTFLLDPATSAISSTTVVGLYGNDVGDVLTVYEATKKAAVDPYIALREAYVAYRKQQILH